MMEYLRLLHRNNDARNFRTAPGLGRKRVMMHPRALMGPTLFSLAVLAGAGFDPRQALAQSAADESPTIDEILVRGSRLPDTVESFPGSFTIVSTEDVDRQRAFNKDLISMLSNEVPGFGTSPGSISNFDTPMRGRTAVVLIDGVPITPTLRPAGRDIVSIDASSIARIEVIRGASSLYGNGGAGGVINFITRRAQEEGLAFSTEVGVGASLTHPGDSWNPTLLQTVEGKRGATDFIVSAYYEQINSLFDADGDRIPPTQTGNGGLPDSEIINLFAKVGFDWERQRVELSGLYFDIGQDTHYFPVPGVVATRSKTTAARGMVDPRAQDEGNRNIVLNAVYTHERVLRSTFRVQGYYQEVEQTFDFRADRFDGSQTLIESKKHGARLDLNTPLDFGRIDGSLLWGLDYTRDRTAQLLTDGRIFVPYLDQDAFAQFAQLELSLTSWLELQAGVRHESFDVEVEPFTSLSSGVDVLGGKLDYNATVYNVGTVFHLTRDSELFLAYSEGYSLSDIGREMRDTAVPGFVEQLRPDPIIYDNYEAGLRFRRQGYSGGVSAFYSESELGQRLVADPNNPGLLIQQRDPEKIRGIEAWVTAQLAEQWKAGTTITKLEGKFDSNRDGHFDRHLDSRRISPLKVTAFVEYGQAEDWLLRLQGLHSGSRDKFDNSLVSGLGRVDSFTTFDLSAARPVGPGQLSLGVQNLLNKDYYSVSAQTQNNASRLAKAPGAMAFIRYRIRY